MKLALIAVPLLAFAATAQADVTVSFTEPGRFTDIKDNDGFRRPAILKDIEAHLIAQASKRFPRQDLRIEVIDVDLAGDVEPFGRYGQWLRVMRGVTIPAISLRYELRQPGEPPRQGEARLRDLSYQDGFNPYASGDPLRYERRMIDRWLEREFSPAVAAAR